MRINRSPVYKIGSPSVQVDRSFPISQEAIAIEVDDYEISRIQNI